MANKPKPRGQRENDQNEVGDRAATGLQEENTDTVNTVILRGQKADKSENKDPLSGD